MPPAASTLAFGAVDKILADGARGAGVFVVAIPRDANWLCG